MHIREKKRWRGRREKVVDRERKDGEEIVDRREKKMERREEEDFRQKRIKDGEEGGKRLDKRIGGREKSNRGEKERRSVLLGWASSACR